MGILAKYPGYCSVCSEKYIVGESEITKDDALSEKANKAIWIHESCATPPEKPVTGPWSDGIKTELASDNPKAKQNVSEAELDKVFGGTNVDDLDDLDDDNPGANY